MEAPLSAATRILRAPLRRRTPFRYTPRPMQKQAWTWTSTRFPHPARLVRWGHFGVPVLIFPTAGGDFEEIERFQLVAALGSLIDGGRIKVYSVDGLAARARLAASANIDERFDSFLYEEVLQRVRADCQDARIEPMLVGATLGAATAISTLMRHPDAFRAAIGMSGVYGDTINEVADLSVSRLEQLKGCPITLGTGGGDYENPSDSKRLADALGAKGIPCRCKYWGPARDRTWSTWRDQLPGLLGELL
jgi:esterase/lipase superfamily enzyme